MPIITPSDWVLCGPHPAMDAGADRPRLLARFSQVARGDLEAPGDGEEPTVGRCGMRRLLGCGCPVLG